MMAGMHGYPEQLAAFVAEQWSRARELLSWMEEELPRMAQPLPAPEVLRGLLSICYQASLLRDEERSVRFRLFLCDPESLAAMPEARGFDVFALERPLTLHEQEIRRLSQAAPYERSLIAARLHPDGQGSIWGVIRTGADWLHLAEGRRRDVSWLPPVLTIGSSAPGRITVGQGSVTVARLVAGKVQAPDPRFHLLPSHVMRTEENKGILDQLIQAERLRSGRPWAKVSEKFFNLFFDHFIRRILSTVRAAQHGASFVTIPDGMPGGTAGLASYIDLKYPLLRPEAFRSFRQLSIHILARLAETQFDPADPDRVVRWRDYLSSTDPMIVQTDKRLSELVQFLADLAAVDGAVLLERPVNVLGFGGEISGNLTRVEQVARALDETGEKYQLESTYGVGTRHRSVYRLCRALPEVTALVVSQDGGTQFVMNNGGRVTYWNQFTQGPLDP